MGFAKNWIKSITKFLTKFFPIADTVFTPVSAQVAHLILVSQIATLIWGRRSFDGGAH